MQNVGARLDEVPLRGYRMLLSRPKINSFKLKSRLASTGDTFLTFWSKNGSRRFHYLAKIVEGILKIAISELASGSQRQPAAATGSYRQPAEMGFGPRLGTTLPHAPGAKIGMVAHMPWYDSPYAMIWSPRERPGDGQGAAGG